MKYKEILKELSVKENTSPKNIEREMEFALKLAGLDCSVKKFLDSVIFLLNKDYI